MSTGGAGAADDYAADEEDLPSAYGSQFEK